MHHGVRDLNAGRKAVEYEPANFRLEDRDEVGKIAQILLSAVNRCGQVAFESARDFQNLIAA